MTAERVHGQFCNGPTDHDGECVEHYCDCERCGFWDDDVAVDGLLAHVRELELKVQTLEAVIAATHEMAELSLCVARAGVVVRRSDDYPAPNPLNVPPPGAEPNLQATDKSSVGVKL